MTHRQYVAWHLWLAEQWSKPSRTDYYLAQIACEVRRVLMKNPNKVKLKHFILKFDSKGGKQKPITKAQAADQAKARWASVFRMTKEQFEEKLEKPPDYVPPTYARSPSGTKVDEYDVDTD